MNYESESFRNGTKVEGRYPNYFMVGPNNFEFVLRARSKITWHFCIPTSPYLSSIFIRKNPRNSPLLLRFCSIRLMKSTANLGTNSTNLFLTELLTSTSFYPENGHAQLHTRIVTTPIYAKTLLKTLRESIERHKQTFGAIHKEDEEDVR